MRYQVIAVYQQFPQRQYVAKCLKAHSPQFVVIDSPHTLCIDLDILNIDPATDCATSAMGEDIQLNVIQRFDQIEQLYATEH